MAIIKGQAEIETGDVLYFKTSADLVEGNTPQDNLLINSDFRSGIINQKWQSSYGNGFNVYTIDMWKMVGEDKLTTVTVGDGYLRVYGNIAQILSNKFENTIYTIAIKIRNQDVKLIKIDFKGSYITGGDNNLQVAISNANDLPTFYLYTQSKTYDIEFIKLEKGSFFTGMPLWNETEELLKCMRKFQVIDYFGMNCFPEDNRLGQFMGWTLPIEMDKIPKLTIKSIQTMYGSAISLDYFKDFEFITKRGFYKFNFKSEMQFDKRSVNAVIWADSNDY